MSTNNTQTVNLYREFAMARFAEPHLAAAPRAAAPCSPLMIGNMGSGLDGSRALAGMLLAAVIAALLVVADQVIDAWSDGHMLAGWVALWAVAFAALALLANPLRQVASLGAHAMHRRLVHARAQRLEARMWDAAKHDPRVMEEIRAAMARQS